MKAQSDIFNSILEEFANYILSSSHPEDDLRLDIAYEIARYLKIDCPCAYETETKEEKYNKEGKSEKYSLEKGYSLGYPQEPGMYYCSINSDSYFVWKKYNNKIDVDSICEIITSLEVMGEHVLAGKLAKYING